MSASHRLLVRSRPLASARDGSVAPEQASGPGTGHGRLWFAIVAARGQPDVLTVQTERLVSHRAPRLQLARPRSSTSLPHATSRKRIPPWRQARRRDRRDRAVRRNRENDPRASSRHCGQLRRARLGSVIHRPARTRHRSAGLPPEVEKSQASAVRAGRARWRYSKRSCKVWGGSTKCTRSW